MTAEVPMKIHLSGMAVFASMPQQALCAEMQKGSLQEKVMMEKMVIEEEAMACRDLFRANTDHALDGFQNVSL